MSDYDKSDTTSVSSDSPSLDPTSHESATNEDILRALHRVTRKLEGMEKDLRDLKRDVRVLSTGGKARTVETEPAIGSIPTSSAPVDYDQLSMPSGTHKGEGKEIEPAQNSVPTDLPPEYAEVSGNSGLSGLKSQALYDRINRDNLLRVQYLTDAPFQVKKTVTDFLNDLRSRSVIDWCTAIDNWVLGTDLKVHYQDATKESQLENEVGLLGHVLEDKYTLFGPRTYKQSDEKVGNPEKAMYQWSSDWEHRGKRTARESIQTAWDAVIDSNVTVWTKNAPENSKSVLTDPTWVAERQKLASAMQLSMQNVPNMSDVYKSRGGRFGKEKQYHGPA